MLERHVFKYVDEHLLPRERHSQSMGSGGGNTLDDALARVQGNARPCLLFGGVASLLFNIRLVRW